MRTSRVVLGALVGAVVGAVVVWRWGRQIEEYVEEKTRGVRTKAAAGLRAVEEKAGQVLDRGGDAVRRVEEFVRDTKEDVSEVLRSGQDAIRPGPAANKP
jgi:gas vesicle protein